MPKLDQMSGGAWKSAGTQTGAFIRETVKARVSGSARVLICVDADEPSDAMMRKIHSVLPQDQFTAEESI